MTSRKLLVAVSIAWAVAATTVCAQGVGVGLDAQAGAKTGQSRDDAKVRSGVNAGAHVNSGSSVDANAGAGAKAATERKRGGAPATAGVVTGTNQDAGVSQK